MAYIAALRQSNRATWRDILEISDADTGDLIDLTGARITMTLCGERGDTLKASTDDGSINVIDLGKAEFVFTKDQMGGLCAGSYSIGARVQRETGGDVEQLLEGSVYIYEGVDRQ